jgi:hypothetical protein
MKKLIITSLFATMLCLFFSESAFAQFRPRRPDIRKRRMAQQFAPKEMIGVRIGNSFTHETYSAGAHLWIPAGLLWRFVPSVDYYFLDADMAQTRWQFNGDLVFQPRPNGLIYFGGGLAVNYLIPEEATSSTEYGGNVLVGLQTNPRKPMGLFLQARWTFYDETEFALVGGINMQLR